MNKGLTQLKIVSIVVLVFAISIAVVYWAQIAVEYDVPAMTASSKEQFEIAKIAAEIRQIRSDTTGSLFWLKMIALFVTVGGAVGGYLIGQSAATQARIDFEHRQIVDAAYQTIVKELADDSPLLRAAAAVKLGMVLRGFPNEWNVSDDRRKQLIQLTKQVLAASLSIEKEETVLKTLTISIALHRPPETKPESPDATHYNDLRQIDLSAARAHDAYWAKVDFTYADLYKADLKEASFRGSLLHGTQLREADLTSAVFAKAICTEANFKMADLRYADLTGATLTKANFEGAKVFGAKLSGVKTSENPNVLVDISPAGDGSAMTPVSVWLESLQKA